MFENRSAVSFALTSALIVASSIWVPGLFVVEQARKIAAARVAAIGRIRPDRLMSTSLAPLARSSELDRSGRSGAVCTKHRPCQRAKTHSRRGRGSARDASAGTGAADPDVGLPGPLRSQRAEHGT